MHENDRISSNEIVFLCVLSLLTLSLNGAESSEKIIRKRIAGGFFFFIGCKTWEMALSNIYWLGFGIFSLCPKEREQKKPLWYGQKRSHTVTGDMKVFDVKG